MAYFNTSIGISSPYTFPPLGAPASVEDDSTVQSSHLDSIDSIFDCLEGHFLYDDGTLPHNTTGFESKGSSVSTFPPR